MFNDGLMGSGIHDSNVRFRMYLVVTVAIFALGSVMYWRTQALLAADYVDFPEHKQARTMHTSGLLKNVEQVNEIN